MKNHRELEVIVKGFANHRRIDALSIIESNPGIILEDIADVSKTHYKTVAQHVQKLDKAGLIKKKYLKSSVQHSITKRGKSILIFLRNIE